MVRVTAYDPGRLVSLPVVDEGAPAALLVLLESELLTLEPLTTVVPLGFNAILAAFPAIDPPPALPTPTRGGMEAENCCDR